MTSTASPHIVHCHVTSCEPLSQDVMRLWLQGPDALEYQAGQYLEIQVQASGEERWLPFSIANACTHDGTLELHIQFQAGSDSLAALKAQLESGDSITVKLPSGGCVLQKDDQRPLLLVAAATGMAQMKAIAEAALQNDPQRPIALWWGGRTPEDLYLHSQLTQWAASEPALTYFPVIEAPGEHDIDGVIARIDEALVQQVRQHRHYSIFLSGSPGMVYSVVDSLAAIEPMTEHVFSDVFSYAPR